MRILGVYALALLLAACTNALSTPTPIVIFDGIKVLADGELASFKLDPGRYHLELTASNSGVKVEWGGGLCTDVDSTKRLQTDCTLAQSGQLVVQNPRVLGINLGSLHLGSPTSVSIKLVHYPAAAK